MITAFARILCTILHISRMSETGESASDEKQILSPDRADLITWHHRPAIISGSPGNEIAIHPSDEREEANHR
jgi:hypothetical protein